MDTKKLYRAKPFFPQEDKELIKQQWSDILDTGMFIQGKHVSQFEKEFANYCGTKYAVATSSGAASLEVALRATGIENKKFLVPTQTFVASVSAIIRSNNIPIITDIDYDTQCLNLDIIKANMSDDLAGIMWVHMAGVIPSDYFEIKKYCDENNLIIIEDASHAVGSSVDNIKAGNLGLAGCFSLFATKIVTSGEGGMITTNDSEFIEKCKVIRNHGSVRNESPIPGLDFGVNCIYASSNYRMSEVHAVLGLSQIKRADEFVNKRNILADKYQKTITNNKIITPTIPDNVKITWWQYIIKIKDITREQRTQICKDLLDKYNIPTANAYWPACHEQPAFSEYLKYCNTKSWPNADKLLSQHIALPMYYEMDLDQVDYVSNALNELI
jgi:perosamine synthetase